jgi:hypothetical protein
VPDAVVKGAAHRNKNADVAVRCTFNPPLCIKSYRRLAALPLGVGLILVALILKFQGLLLFELSQILRQLPIDSILFS